jgi:hypothetical protein
MRVNGEQPRYVWASHFGICQGLPLDVVAERVSDKAGTYDSPTKGLITHGRRTHRLCPICGTPWVRTDTNHRVVSIHHRPRGP